MFNRKLFDAAVKASGKKKGYIAAKLGITRQAMNKKERGVSDFSATDMTIVSNELNLSPDERDSIFFAHEV